MAKPIEQEIKVIALESAIKFSNESDSIDSVLANAKKIEDYLSLS